MYWIVASRDRIGAFLKKDDGTYYFSLGPDSQWNVAERDLIWQANGVRDVEKHVAHSGYELHEPPIEILKVQDWPKALEDSKRSKDAISESSSMEEHL